MTEPSINESSQFSSELRNLAAAGIPLQFDIGPNFESDLGKDTHLAARYRVALEIWLACDRSPVALDSMTAMAIRNQSSHRTLAVALVQPILLITLGYLALIYISVSTIPKIEAIYQQIQKPPGFGLWVMSWIRRTMWLWTVLVPTIAAVCAFLRWYKPSSVKLEETSHTNQSSTYLQSAIYSEQLAELLCCNRSIEELVSPVAPAQQSVSPEKLPLLLWATTSQKNCFNVDQLRLVARTYRFLDQIRVQQFRSWLPAIVIGTLGGAIVLAIGLSVFIPIVELLIDLSTPSER